MLQVIRQRMLGWQLNHSLFRS